MDKLLQVLRHPLTLIGLAWLCLANLLWWLGPLISWNGVHPLAGMLARLTSVLVLLLLFAAPYGVHLWMRKRTNARLVASITGGKSSSDHEVEVLQQRFTEALQVLEDSARQAGKRSLLKPQQFLYEQPWYVFIGAPGSGKTTALLNAGLTFPLAGKMGQASVKGVGGTRNCDWWFTENAVLIDTAGRYTLQQSDETVDAAAWAAFLTQLRRARPERPLNGVLLTVNIQDLLLQGATERQEHALKLRTRLQELHEQLGVRPPVYVLVTKCDLIAGFNESFEALGKEEREQVWGFSFTYEPEAATPPMAAFSSEFAALGERLCTQLLGRMEAESDPLRRAAIFAFPQQFAGLQGLLGGFLEQVFEGGAGLEERTLLRGVYFTSGTQEGSPIDRVLGTLARSFGLDARPAAATGAGGKSYFLTRLLRDVVFAEQGLVGQSQQALARRRWHRGLGLAGLGTVSLALLVGWGISFQRNLAYIDEVAARLPAVKAAVDGLPPASASTVTLLPQVLDPLLAAPQPSGFALDAPPLLHALGLYQGDHVAAGVDIGYHRLLEHALMPRVAQRLEERLRAAHRDNLELAYEALKAYVMLYTPDRFDAEGLKAWVTLDWEANLARTLSAEQLASLSRHLDAALARGAPQPRAPMDKALVASVREMLVAYPLEFRIVSRLKRAQVGNDFPPFTAASAGGPNAIRVFERASGKPLTQGIPGLFTRDGYEKAFKGAQAKVTRQLADEEGWVLGTPSGAAADPQAKAAALLVGDAELDARVRRLYLGEYIRIWDAYLADVRLIKLDGLDRSLSVSRLLAAPDSPLGNYLRAVARETQLGAAQAAASGRGEATLNTPSARVNNIQREVQEAQELRRDLTAIIGGGAGGAPEGGAGRPLEFMVDDHFAHIHRLVEGTPPPLQDVQKLFGEVAAQLTAIDAAQKSKSPPPPGTAAGAVKAAAGMQPEPIKSMLETLVDAGASQSRTAERQGLSVELRPITEQCTKTIAGRFPFARGASADVLPDDFGQMFGVGGLLDDFYARRLATLVDTGTTPWAYRPLTDGTRPPGGAALADFQRAAAIRDAFFRAGGKTPGFRVDLRMLEMDPALKEVTLDVDGTVLRFAEGSTAAQTFTWPSARIASQIRLGAAGGGTQVFEGPWALFRLIGKFEVQASTQPERFVVVLNLDGKRARMEVISASALNPLRLRELQTFRCPDGL